MSFPYTSRQQQGSSFSVARTLSGHSGFVMALLQPRGSPDRLVSGARDGLIKVWDYHTGERLDWTPSLPSPTCPALLSPLLCSPTLTCMCQGRACRLCRDTTARCAAWPTGPTTGSSAAEWTRSSGCGPQVPARYAPSSMS